MARRDLDRYLTPTWATEALLQHFPQIRGETLLDPCCGDGRMAGQMGQRFRRAITCDIDRAAAARGNFLPPLDAAQSENWAEYKERCGRIDWVVTNPPFNCAGDIAQLALRNAQNVALLLRATFGEPCGASAIAPRNGRRWLVQNPPTALLMLPRISFTGDGKSDSAPCWWFIWSSEVQGVKVAARAESAGQLSLVAHAG